MASSTIVLIETPTSMEDTEETEIPILMSSDPLVPVGRLQITFN